VFDFAAHAVGLPKPIELKRVAGRPKDNEAIAELEALLEESTRFPGRQRRARRGTTWW